MAVMTSLDINVYDAALERVRLVYDLCDDVIVSMSGGKDSTVLLHLALTVAAERGKLPLKVYWLDQEAEWQATVDYMAGVMRRPDVIPYWYQFPFRLTNSMSHTDSYLRVWDPEAEALWVHEKDPLSIKVNPLSGFDRFHTIVKNLPSAIMPELKHVGVLVGIRMAESQARRYLLWRGVHLDEVDESAVLEATLAHPEFGAQRISELLAQRGHQITARTVGETWARHNMGTEAGRRRAAATQGQGPDTAGWRGILWCHRRMIANTRTFWPMYDWEDADVFACIAKNDLPHNEIYDSFYRFGVSGRLMRVSALCHETSWHALRLVQTVEPATYNKLLARLPGSNAFSHLIDDIVPKRLPAYFQSWLEYRDYLLENLVQPELREMFRKRWKNQHGDVYYKIHVSEIVVNDVDRTKNMNGRIKQRMINFHKQATA